MARVTEVHVHYHLPEFERLAHRLIEIGEQALADLSRIQTEVSEARTVQEGAVALLANLAQQIRDNATDQAALNDLADSLDASSTALGQAVADNTPSA